SSSSGGSSSSGVNQPAEDRWFDLEQLWDYSSLPDPYSESDDAWEGNPTIDEDWREDGLLAAQLQSTRPLSRRLEAAMSLPSSLSSTTRRQRKHQHQQLQHQQLLDPARSRNWPEVAELATKLSEGRRRLRRLRLDEEAAAAAPAVGGVKDAVGSADVSVEAEEEDDGLSSFPMLLAGATRRRLPADLLRRWDRLARSLLTAEVDRRLRQITEAALAVADKQAIDIDIVADCRRYSTADEAAEDVRQIGELDAQLRRWLAGLGGLRTRLVEAARLPTSASASGQQRRQRRRVKEKLDSLDLMRRWFQSDRRRYLDRQHSAQAALNELTELESLIGQCEQDATRAFKSSLGDDLQV
uniref:ASD2 domain-containing protein n=1 Tax=Macrostomum lignano TaxID=282301 RepID=A0A1I8HAU4_9PLAT